MKNIYISAYSIFMMPPICLSHAAFAAPALIHILIIFHLYNCNSLLIGFSVISVWFRNAFFTFKLELSSSLDNLTLIKTL